MAKLAKLLNRSGLISASVFLLCACVGKFDNEFYKRLVDIQYDISDPSTFCRDQTTMKTGVATLKHDVDWVVIYEKSFGDVNFNKILEGLKDDTDRFANIVNGTTSPSKTYCFNKINNISRIITTALNTEALKPK